MPAFKQNRAVRFFLLWMSIFAASAVPILCQTDNPVADPNALVLAGQARFTVLTAQLIRMEWTENRRFEDHASLVFIHRRLPVPSFKTRTEGEWLVVETGKLILKYKKDSGKFNADNLAVEFNLNGRTVIWHPGMEDKGNLGGTIRTLDGVQGDTPLEPGLISRDGWVLVDDSTRPLFDNSDWPWVMPRPSGERQDWYFFGYGHDYRNALTDFTRVAGKIPMPPRFAFGTWWSRYWSYTDQEFKRLVREFESHDVPLDVLVIDMDWHQTFNLRWSENRRDQAGQHLGWSGYTWDKTLFPDPEGFLAWCEKHGLKTPLNLHPASGVQPHEERYPEMARAMGIDPASRKYVPFDIVDKKFATNYMNILHHPLEKQGVDFWWLDWQQQPTTRIPGVNPTWWLNYVHFADMEREGKRPLIFHRWGGLGNHRYQIGFSGDTISVWESLAFQPYFTVTAANVGYSYWSHDIGGHMPGKVSPELYTRWIQFGVFSPILRTHTTKNPQAERRLWAYPAQYAAMMRHAFLLRYALIPYIYTASRETYETGVAFLRPMYYDYPEAPEAYEFKDQYLFGDRMMVAPIATPVDAANLLAPKSIWLPEGEWMEWSSGARLKGPARLERSFAVDEIPIYIKAGSIIPMQPKMRNTRAKPVDPLLLNVFPGASGATRIYEDEGDTLGYKHGEYAWTTVRQGRLNDGSVKIEILPAEGHYPGMLKERAYEIRLVGVWPPDSIMYEGKPVPFSRDKTAPSWRYDGEKLTTIISIPKSNVASKVEILIRQPWLDSQSPLLDGVPGKLARLSRARDVLNNLWPQDWSPDSLIQLAQTGNRITLNPKNALEELEKLNREWPGVLQEISTLKGDETIKSHALAHLGGQK